MNARSVSKFRLLFVGLVFAILSFSVQFSVPTANRAARGSQLAAWILLLLTGMLSLRDAGGFVARNMKSCSRAWPLRGGDSCGGASCSRLSC